MLGENPIIKSIIQSYWVFLAMTVTEADYIKNSGLVIFTYRYHNFLYILIYLLTSAAIKTFVSASLTFYDVHNILHINYHNIVL